MKMKKILALTGAAAMALTSLPVTGITASADDLEEIVFATPLTKTVDMTQIETELNKITEEKIGVHVKIEGINLSNYTNQIGLMMSGGEQLDAFGFLGSYSGMLAKNQFLKLDDYLDEYPNIKAYYTDEEWNKLRRDDGHIYWIQQFQNVKGEEKATTHNDEAFWIQTRVLEWAGYPEVNTLDEYFDLLESYMEANPTMEDGTENIAYTILCEDWRYYCLENAPQFLDGYPNDGSVIVDPDELKVIDYNTTDTAKRYFQKLNEEYKKGYVDPESFTQTYDEYIAKLSTGRVLGMVDQWWDFAYNVNDSLKQQGLDEKGCSYVPLPITIDEGIKNQWHCSGGVMNSGSGLAITTSCKDVEGALQFIDDLLSQDIHNLRFWGVEGVDYEVNDDGLFYRTEEQRKQAADTAYKASHLCSYSYFPNYKGTSDDGINANWPDDQPDEFFDSLNSAVQRCFKAYGAETYVDMLGTNETPGPWYPMYSFSGTMTTSTPGGVAWTKMGEIKHEYLPRTVMANDFESEWNTYMKAYEGCNPQDFLDEMQAELDRRMKEAAKFE